MTGGDMSMHCHMGIGAKGGNHARNLRLPDRAVCGSCWRRPACRFNLPP